MKKYLYMIVALFGIDYFCKENIEAQKPEDFPRDMEKAMERSVCTAITTTVSVLE